MLGGRITPDRRCSQQAHQHDSLWVLSENAVLTTSDSAGRYSAAVRGDVVMITPVEIAAYLSPCPSGTTWLSGNLNRPLDVHVVSKAVLSTAGLPDSYPITSDG